MSGQYNVSVAAVAVTAAQDLFEVTNNSAKPTVPIGFNIGQTSDVGDAAEEILQIALKSGQTTSGSGGSSPTPSNNDPGSGAAASAVVEANNTTKASAGTIVTHGVWSWNVRTELAVLFTQEQQKIMAGGRRWTLELVAAPADSLTMNISLDFQEIG